MIAHTPRSSIVCDLRRKRFNVTTFKGDRQQTRWLAKVDYAFPDGGYIGLGRGFVSVACNGNWAAASAGAGAVSGAVVPAGLQPAGIPP